MFNLVYRARGTLLRALTALGVVLALFTTCAVPVGATAVPNSAPSIEYVNIYKTWLTNDDQLWLIGYNWPYTGSYPTQYPSEDATQTILVKIMDGATILYATTPVNYYRLGYNKGMVAIYFSTATAPTWNTGYTVIIEGNPLITWSGGARPSVSYGGSLTWQPTTTPPTLAITSALVRAKLMTEAIGLGNSWAYDLTTTSEGVTYLSQYGDAYFSAVVPSLHTAIPNVGTTYSQQPVITKPTRGTGFADQLRADMDGIFDTSNLEGLVGVPATYIIGFLYMAAVAYIVYKMLRGLKSYRPAILLAVPFIIVGGKLGILPLIIGIIMAAIGGLITLTAARIEPGGIVN